MKKSGMKAAEAVASPTDLEFRVTQEAVKRFAELTGDRSSLHMDAPFARHSMYRRTVVHGMLPVTFLVAAHSRLVPNGTIARIAARFLKPVFAGDRLSISAKVLEAAGKETSEMDYTIKNVESGAIVTTAQVVCGTGKDKRESSISRPAARPAANGTLLIGPLSEQEWQFDQITKGQQTGFGFRVSAESLTLFRSLLTDGLDRKDGKLPNDLRETGAADLLAASLVSTFAGMCLPGKHATLMDFVMNFTAPIQMDTSYRLTGTVEHKSQSTGSLIEGISIRQDGEQGGTVATGKVSVKVNEPSSKGPALAALRERDTDLGLKDKVAVVTGASRGIGATTAKLLSLYGAKVVVNYVQARQEAEDVVAEIVEGGGNAIAVQADVSDRGQVQRMISAACERYRTVDILVNNAVADFHPIPFAELTWERIQRDFDVIVKGAFNCCQEALPLMIRNGGGKIINLSSVATDVPPPNQLKYVAAKSALTGLTRSLAIDLAAHNIQVNMVVAGLVETDLVKHLPKLFVKGMQNDVPMKRHATTTDVAKAIVFLASALSAFTTGQRIMVTGGNPPFL
jgi:3-oxoacyl-[acyl-carrier protein] reductase